MAEEDKKETETPESEAEEGTEGEDGESTAPKSKKKLFIIIGAAVVLILIIVAVLFLFVFKSEPETELNPEGEDITSITPASLADGPSLFKDLDQLSINLLTDRGNRFLKLKLTLEFIGPLDEAAYAAALPRIQDDLNTYLRNRRPDDFKGTANIYKLKEDLILRLGQASHPLRLKNVLFRELVVQ